MEEEDITRILQIRNLLATYNLDSILEDIAFLPKATSNGSVNEYIKTEYYGVKVLTL